mgnify:CR=1 FL=1
MPSERPFIHRFWSGREIPADYEVFEHMWQDLNPDYNVVTWDERCLVDFPKLKPVFDDLYRRDNGRHGIELYVQLADVVGYALIKRWGGVYVNCDMEPVRPLPEMPNQAWASYENYTDYRIVNAAIGAPEPQDRFWQRIIEGLPARYFANPTAEMVETTGPAYLTDMANAHRDEIYVFPKEAFCHVHWGEVAPGGDASAWRDQLPEEAIALHHWGHKKTGRTNRVETATQ